MWQAGTAVREFAREFERRARDAGMAEEDAKVYLVSALNQDTLAHLGEGVPPVWGCCVCSRREKKVPVCQQPGRYLRRVG